MIIHRLKTKDPYLLCHFGYIKLTISTFSDFSLIQIYHLTDLETTCVKYSSAILVVYLSQWSLFQFELKFSDILVGSRKAAELMLPPPRSILDISVLLDVIELGIQALLGIDVLAEPIFLLKT